MNDLLARRPGWVMVILTIVAAIPLYWPALPPLTDLMGHIGRYSVQLDLASDPQLQRFYSFKWAMIPNLGVDLLIGPVAALFGIETGVKLIVIAIVMATVAGFLAVGRAAQGRTAVASYFALPLTYGFPFHFGFVNYCLSMALAFLAFAWWLRLGRQGRIGYRAALFVPLAVIVWITHVSGWGALGLFALAGEYTRLRERGESRTRSVVLGVVHCLPLVLPAFLMIVSREGAQGDTIHFFEWATKYQWVVRALSDRWELFDICSVGLILALPIAAIVLPVLRLDRTLGLAAFLLFIAFLCIPRVLIGSAYADMRLVPSILAMALLAIEVKPFASPRIGRVLIVSGLLFFMVRTAATTVSFLDYDRLMRSELAAVDHIPRGARVIALTGRTCRASWMQERRTHLSSLALARKHVYINDQFIMAGAQLLGVHYPAAGRFYKDPSQMAVADNCVRQDWSRLADAVRDFPRDAFDYLWVINPPKSDTVNYAGLEPVWRWRTSVLFRIPKTGRPSMTRRTVTAPVRQDAARPRTGT